MKCAGRDDDWEVWRTLMSVAPGMPHGSFQCLIRGLRYFELTVMSEITESAKRFQKFQPTVIIRVTILCLSIRLHFAA